MSEAVSSGTTALGALADSAPGALGRAARSLDQARLAGRLGHAYLLVGPSGAGKRALAAALARDLLGFIRHDGSHPDLTTVAPEEGKREIGIDLVRAACAEFVLAPLEARGRLAIVHGADVLGEEAANALLKTLEEPPEGGVLVLTTSRPEAVLPTIRSRCMTLRLPPAPSSEAAASPLARAGEALLEPAREPFERAARASAAALEAATEGEEDRPALEKKRRAVNALLDGAGAALARRARERAAQGLPVAAEEAAVESLALAAEQIEANAVPELVVEVLSLSLWRIAATLGPLSGGTHA